MSYNTAAAPLAAYPHAKSPVGESYSHLRRCDMQYFIENDFFQDLVQKAENRNVIDPACYDQYHVMRGLRHKNGTGVLVGLTEIADVHGYTLENNKKIPAEGTLFYRGIDMADIMHNCQLENRRGFEETAYLLLLGELPNKSQLRKFDQMLDDNRFLPRDFTENMILQAPSKDVMNNLQRCILVLYSYDENPDDIRVANLLRQSIQLMAQFPTIISYGYQAKAHYFENKSLYIHSPQPGIGTAENVLHMIRKDNTYTKTEAETLDLCMVIHAEHGGGNNSTFANRVVSSSGTDTYSAIATAVGSMKGPKHGGANKKVKSMVEDIKANCHDWGNQTALRDYLLKILQKEAFNGEGLIYGMGHAIYTLSDPRAVLLREKAQELAKEKGAEEEFALYQNIEELTKEIFKELKGPDYVTCANVDLYSGFVYELLGIPEDLYTPLFAAARISGWCANRIEQIVSDNRIIRPAYKSVSPKSTYVPLAFREK